MQKLPADDPLKTQEEYNHGQKSTFRAHEGTCGRRKKSWCIPKPSASYQQLIENMSYACNLVNCSAVQSEAAGACYYPNSLINHAAFAMNLYYQNAGANTWNCDFNNSAVIALTDPSYGACNFQCRTF
ncbi:unnamed protein product [Cuscuta campestris]|uniref:X8 domain-containing protein n=1 Tax=Cuscuta campestris TaxID=132261 RepID=A0A484KAL4_9ASTE|nr:unnamed protein product [Cuscuta campestris]